MIGGPLLFMIVAVWGLRQLSGPPANVPPVERLRDGSVRPGMTEEEVVKIAGRPKSVSEGADGRTTYRYMDSAWDVQRGTFVEEDAYVDFDSRGQVSNVTFESRTPEPPK